MWEKVRRINKLLPDYPMWPRYTTLRTRGKRVAPISDSQAARKLKSSPLKWEWWPKENPRLGLLIRWSDLKRMGLLNCYVHVLFAKSGSLQRGNGTNSAPRDAATSTTPVVRRGERPVPVICVGIANGLQRMNQEMMRVSNKKGKTDLETKARRE